MSILAAALLFAGPVFAAPVNISAPRAPRAAHKGPSHEITTDYCYAIASKVSADEAPTKALIVQLHAAQARLAALAEARGNLAYQLTQETDPRYRPGIVAQIASVDAQMASQRSQIASISDKIDDQTIDEAVGEGARIRAVAYLDAHPNLAPPDAARWRDAIAKLSAVLAEFQAIVATA